MLKRSWDKVKADFLALQVTRAAPAGHSQPLRGKRRGSRSAHPGMGLPGALVPGHVRLPQSPLALSPAPAPHSTSFQQPLFPSQTSGIIRMTLPFFSSGRINPCCSLCGFPQMQTYSGFLPGKHKSLQTTSSSVHFVQVLEARKASPAPALGGQHHPPPRPFLLNSKVIYLRASFLVWKLLCPHRIFPPRWSLLGEESLSAHAQRFQNPYKEDADLLENGLQDTGRGKGKLGQSDRVAWTYAHYQM